MTEQQQQQIPIEEALRLVEFERDPQGWRVRRVKRDVRGNVLGDVWGHVTGDVWGDVKGSVRGTIKGRKWQFVETPKEKLERLIKETGDEGLLEAFSQLEESND